MNLRVFSAFIALFFAVTSFSQVSVTVTGNTNTTPAMAPSYTSLTDAVTDLSAITTISGPVTLTCAAGSETAPAGGYVINFVATTSLVNSVTLIGTGVTITAPTPQTSGNLNDAIFKIIGSDFVTIQGFTMLENAGNTTTTTGTNNMTEFGVALFYATTTNGCQNITISNNTIDLNRTYTNTFGIYANSTHSATSMTSSATATTPAGGNQNLSITGNNITDVNQGVVVIGPSAAADQNSGMIIQNNSITNYGTAAQATSYNLVSGTMNGILIRNVYGYSITNNTISSSAGGVTVGTLRAIFHNANQNAPTGTFTNVVNNNTVSVQAGAAGATIAGFLLESTCASATSELQISFNEFNSLNHTVAATTAITAISTASTHKSLVIRGNNFNNLAVNTSGSFTFISHNYVMPANGSQFIRDNSVVTAFNKLVAGGTVTFSTTSATASPNTSVAYYDNNNFSNITVTGATTVTGITNIDGSSSSTSVKTCTNNVFNNINAGSSSVTCINISYFQTGSHTISNNTITNINSQGAITGISINSSANAATSLSISSNTINSLISSVTGGNVNGITCSNTSTGINIFQNTINTLSSSGTASTISGINITGATLTNIYKNKIYDLSGNQAGTLVNGINITSGSTLNIYNNLVGDLRATAATGLNAINGINASASSTYNIYYNTIYLNATSTSSTTFGSSCINFSSTVTLLTLRNNILFNASIPAQEGLNSEANGISACLRRSSGTNGTVPSNYSTASNNNAFWANPVAGTNNHLTYVEGTSTITNPKNTLANAKSFFTNRDQGSIQENPTWQSTAGGSPNFLKFNISIASQMESGAINIATFTDDFNNTIRQGNPGYTGTSTSGPDIGAWELDGIPLDLTGPTISYTLLSNTSCNANVTLNPVTINDGSGVNITPGSRPRLYYKKSTHSNTFVDNTSASDGWKFVEASGSGGSPFSFTADYTLLFGGSGVTNGDIVQYFVVAQDNAGTPNVAINSGLFNLPPASVGLTSSHFPIGGTINSFNIVSAGLSGTKTIGAAGDYTTLTGTGGLFEAINNNGLSASLTANIVDASITETGAVSLNSINYNGCIAGPYNLIIKPNSTATLTGSVASGALIKLNGADYVTIDGSNSGGTDRSLTISNTSSTTPTVISLISLGTGLGATNNTIKNCNINTGVTSPGTSFGISIGGATSGTSGADNDDALIQNNLITSAAVGIYANGTAALSTGGNNNLYIISNEINTITSVAALGIQVGNGLNSKIHNNVLNIETSASSAPVGISLETGFNNSTIDANNITKVLATNTGGYAGRGITIGSGILTSGLTISNNFISNVNGSNWSSFGNSSSIGIAIGVIGNSTTLTTTAGGINLFNNSVNLNGTYSTTTSSVVTAALYIGSSASSLDIRNNIFVNSLLNSGTGTTPKSYAVYSAVSNTAFTNINYNDYFISGANGILGYLTSDRTDLASWKTATGQDLQSVSANPNFISNTDLHISTSMATIVESAGTPLAGILMDFDGNTRNVTTPDLGADEGTFIPLVSNDVQATAFVNPLNASSKPVGIAFTPIASFTNLGTSNQTNVTVRYRILNSSMVEVYNETDVITSLASGASYSDTFPSVMLPLAGSYTMYAKSELVGDQNTSNDEISGSLSAELPLCGTYAVGASQPLGFQNLTQAINKLNALGVSCAVTYELQSDYISSGETFPLTINPITGISSVNTFTLKPGSGVNATISGAASNNALIKILSNYVTIDGSNSGSTTRNLSISNTSISSPSAILIGSSGTVPITNVIFKNCTVTNGINTSSAIVASDATTLGNDGYFNNILIQNNSIRKAYIGVYARAAASAGNGSGLVISNNDLTSSGANSLRYIGIYVQGVDGAVISNNSIGNFDTSTDEDDKGISLATGAKNVNVIGNSITNIGYTGTGGYGAHGISVATGVTNANISLVNNMISNIFGDGYNYLSTSFSTDNPIGILLTTTQTGINIYNNSIYMSGNTLNQSSALSMGIMMNTGSVADIRNNIIVNNLGLSSATGYGSAGIYAVTANSQFTDINYNDYIVNPTGSGVKNIGQIAASGATTLSAWQTATGKDANSVTIDPVFVSPTDLHLVPLSNIGLDNLGTPIASVTVDIDNQTRSVTTPDMGCDEFSGSSCEGQPLAGNITPATASICSGLTYSMSATGLSSGAGITYQWKSGPSGGPYTNVSGGTGATTESYTTPTLSVGTYYYVLQTTCSSSGQSNLTNEVAVGVTGDEVINENNAGTGSLRKAIECTAANDTVFVSSGSVNLINLLTQLNVDKQLVIKDDNGSPVMLKFDFSTGALMTETNGGLRVGTMGNVTLDNIHVKHVANDASHPVIKNEGILTLKNSKVTGETGNMVPPVVQNATGATINAEGSSEIKNE